MLQWYPFLNVTVTIDRYRAVSSVATTDTLYVGDSGSGKKGDAKKRWLLQKISDNSKLAPQEASEVFPVCLLTSVVRDGS